MQLTTTMSSIYPWPSKCSNNNTLVGTVVVRTSCPYTIQHLINIAKHTAHGQLNDGQKDPRGRLYPTRETPGIEREGERQRAISRQIDRLVYELYGLTEEEINIVEQSLV